MYALPQSWHPPRKTVIAQPDLFGNVKNIRDTIVDVPRITEGFNGLSVSFVRIPEGSTEQYRDEVEKMRRELAPKSSGRELPSWYKYRSIKRGQ
jgi:hypothetical protein